MVCKKYSIATSRNTRQKRAERMRNRSEQPAGEAAEWLDGRLGLSQRQWAKTLEVLAAVALSLSALATSWSGYQASRWSGVMALDFAQTSGLRIASARAAGLASQLTQLDVALFTNWIEATAIKNQALADFYRERFRAEFAPAFAVWLASRPLENPTAPASPFELAEYRLAAAEEADQLEQQAEALFSQAAAANATSDRYVLNSVLLALVLFFSALTARFGLFAVRVALLAIALALLGIGLVNLFSYPIY